LVGVTATLVFFFLVRGSFGIRLGIAALLLTLVYAAITVSSLVRRLELSQDRLRLVQIGWSAECLVRDVASLRLTTIGNGMSRCAVIRRDGAPAFGGTRSAWRTRDLMLLAEAMGVPAAQGPNADRR
jgi:hypothetical protein